MAAELPMKLNFMAFAIPGAISVLAMIIFQISRRRVVAHEAVTPAA